MTERELHKLRRQDLLELLLTQSREAARMQAEYEKLKSAYEERESSYNRLKEKLNEKDQQIEKLIRRLNDKDALIKQLQSVAGETPARSAEVGLGVIEIPRAASKSEPQPRRSGGDRDLAQLLIKVYESSKEKLAQSEETIAQLRQQVAEQDKAKESLRSMLAQSHEMISRLWQQLAERNTTMDTLRFMLEQTQQTEIEKLQILSDSLRNDRAKMLALLEPKESDDVEPEDDLAWDEQLEPQDEELKPADEELEPQDEEFELTDEELEPQDEELEPADEELEPHDEADMV